MLWKHQSNGEEQPGATIAQGYMSVAMTHFSQPTASLPLATSHLSTYHPASNKRVNQCQALIRQHFILQHSVELQISSISTLSYLVASRYRYHLHIANLFSLYRFYTVEDAGQLVSRAPAMGSIKREGRLEGKNAIITGAAG